MSNAWIARWVIVAIVAVPIGGVLFLGSRHSTRDVSFEDAVSGVDFAQRPEPWSIGLSNIEVVEVSGCLLDLVRNTVITPKSLALLNASVPVGGFMVIHLVQPRNLQIAEGMESPVAVGAGTAFTGPSLKWSFDADRDIVLFADQAILDTTSTTLTPGSANRVRLPESPARISIAAANGVRLACRTKTVNGVRHIPSVELIARGSSPLIRVAISADVTNPTLSAPRGSVLVGSKKIALGAGTLTMNGVFGLDAVDWKPGDVDVTPALHGKSSDVRAGGDQLVPSMLSTLTDEPRWAAIVAVVAVMLGSLFGKLFDHALPTTDRKERDQGIQ